MIHANDFWSDIPRGVAADPDRRDAAAIRRHYVDAMLSIYEGQPFLSRLMLQSGRWVLFRMLVSLQDGFDERDRSSWPTLSLVQPALQELGLASPRRVHDMVARLIQTGFVAAVSPASDRRSRILVPTERMLAHHRACLDALPIPPARPAPGAASVSVRPAAAGHARAILDNGPMSFFLRRESGIAILMALMRREWKQPGPVGFDALGRSFGVSRTHVRLLLRAGARAGHLVAAGDDFAVPPATLASFDRFIADEAAAEAARPRAATDRAGAAAAPRTRPAPSPRIGTGQAGRIHLAPAGQHAFRHPSLNKGESRP